MIQDLWRVFPRLIEQNINGLLDEAEPTALRAFQIYRTCKNQGLFRGNIEKFAAHLEVFFAQPRSERRKSQFDFYLDHPMSHDTYDLFHLDFRSAAVKENALQNVASWAFNLIRVSKKTTSECMSLEVMVKTLKRITNPGHLDKAKDIEFRDFCFAWKRTVVKLFGHKHDDELNEVLTELHWLHAQLNKVEAKPVEISLAPGFYLSKTEIDWTIAVREAAQNRLSLPPYPSQIFEPNAHFHDLLRVIRLYGLAQTSTIPEVQENRENIRLTVIDRCDSLLNGLHQQAA